MSAGASLDFAKAQKVAAFEITVAMLELPQGRFGMPSMENVALCIPIVLDKVASRGLGMMRDEPLWNPYIFNCRTNDDMFVCLKYCL